MELHQLRYFVAVAQTGSFSRAAERCHVSQPSLSQQVIKLERRLGRRLFDRLGRRVVLTDAGRLLLDRATAIVAAVEDAQRRVRDADNLEGGRLAVGAIPTIAPYLLPRALKEFVRRHPAVELSVTEDVTRHLLAATAAGDLDLSLVALPVEDDRLHVEPLLTEPLLLALPPGHRLTRRRRVTADELREEPFILLGEMHCLGEQVLSFCRANGCQPRIACRSAQISTIQALIALGQGVSLIPEMARRADPANGRSYRLLADGKPTRTIAAVWHRRRYHSPVAGWFLDTLRKLCAGR
jgi:LysR family transcriptional regulator, hydrogen peroxide-inducible genes activator